MSERCKHRGNLVTSLLPRLEPRICQLLEVGAACEVALEVHFDIVLVQAHEVVPEGFCSTAACSEAAVKERSDPKFSSDELNRWTVV